MTERRRNAGFTLVELILVVTLCAVLGAMVASVLSRPLDNFVGQSRRAELVDRGAVALSRMQRDIHLAVPNSLRVSADGQALELLGIHSAGRYRPNRTGSDSLAFASGTASDCTASGQRCDAVQLLEPGLDPSGARWLVLYNIGAESGGVALAGSNLWAYANPGVVTPSGATFAALAGAPPPDARRITIIGRQPPHASGIRAFRRVRVVGIRPAGGGLQGPRPASIVEAWSNGRRGRGQPERSVRNVERGRVLGRAAALTWLLGGLNYHKEHHLFPLICHANYPALSKLVEGTCRDFGIPYKEHKSFWAGIASHYRWIKRMGTGD